MDVARHIYNLLERLESPPSHASTLTTHLEPRHALDNNDAGEWGLDDSDNDDQDEYDQDEYDQDEYDQDEYDQDEEDVDWQALVESIRASHGTPAASADQLIWYKRVPVPSELAPSTFMTQVRVCVPFEFSVLPTSWPCFADESLNHLLLVLRGVKADVLCHLSSCHARLQVYLLMCGRTDLLNPAVQPSTLFSNVPASEAIKCSQDPLACMEFVATLMPNQLRTHESRLLTNWIYSFFWGRIQLASLEALHRIQTLSVSHPNISWVQESMIDSAEKQISPYVVQMIDVFLNRLVPNDEKFQVADAFLNLFCLSFRISTHHVDRGVLPLLFLLNHCDQPFQYVSQLLPILMRNPKYNDVTLELIKQSFQSQHFSTQMSVTVDALLARNIQLFVALVEHFSIDVSHCLLQKVLVFCIEHKDSVLFDVVLYYDTRIVGYIRHITTLRRTLATVLHDGNAVYDDAVMSRMIASAIDHNRFDLVDGLQPQHLNPFLKRSRMALAQQHALKRMYLLSLVK